VNELWDQPGVPHSGWRCVGCTDLGKPTGQCEMCGKEAIRYVHTMEHDDYAKTLDCGCVCAEKMENDPVRPRQREQRMKSKAGRRSRWLTRRWRVSAKGNDYVVVQGRRITIFPSRFHPGKWSYSIDGQFSKRPFATDEEAKLAAFEEFWARICDE